MRACPQETTLSDFLAGMLSEESRSLVMAHVKRCANLPLTIRAYAYLYSGRSPEARRDLLDALKRLEASHGPGTASTLGAVEKAVPLLERARQIQTRRGELGAPWVVGKTAFALARALRERRSAPDRARARDSRRGQGPPGVPGSPRPGGPPEGAGLAAS